MDFSHNLTLMSPYSKLPMKNGFSYKISPIIFIETEEGEFHSFSSTVNDAEGFAVQIVINKDATYTLAECPDFKTADAFVKIIDSLLQSFQ